MYFVSRHGWDFRDNTLSPSGYEKCAGPSPTATLIGELIPPFTKVRFNCRIAVPVTELPTDGRLDRTMVQNGSAYGKNTDSESYFLFELLLSDAVTPSASSNYPEMILKLIVDRVQRQVAAEFDLL